MRSKHPNFLILIKEIILILIFGEKYSHTEHGSQTDERLTSILQVYWVPMLTPPSLLPDSHLLLLPSMNPLLA